MIYDRLSFYIIIFLIGIHLRGMKLQEKEAQKD